MNEINNHFQPKRVAILTLGCKTNSVESDAIAGALADAGCVVVDFDDVADYYIVNTCTVTHVSDRKSRQMLRRAKRHAPDAKLICMGCFSQLHKEDAERIGADLILGNGNKNLAIDYILHGRGSERFVPSSVPLMTSIPEEKMLSWMPVSAFCSSDESSRDQNSAQEGREIPGNRFSSCTPVSEQLLDFEEIPEYTAAPHTRAFIKIQDGCDRYCTYCIIPYARGPVRSREPERILAEVRRLVASGYSEFVLTGIHLASYGKDFQGKRKRGASFGSFSSDIGESPDVKRRGGKSFNVETVGSVGDETLLDIVEMLNAVEGVRRIRLGSLEPAFVDAKFVERMARCEKLCDHFHLSLQSGSDKVLRLMNRRYSAREFEEAVLRLRGMFEHPSITTDIIAGFPGEGEAEFQETLELVRRVRFSDIHIFPYSERKGTPAVNFKEKVDDATRKRRTAELEKERKKLHEQYLSSFRGKEIEVLVEKVEGGMAMGYSSNYIYAVFEAPNAVTGEYVKFVF